MHYAPTDWFDVVAIRVEGASSSWVNVVLQDVVARRRPIFHTWAQFKEAMVHWFEPIIEVEEVGKHLQASRQTSRAASYVQKF